MLPACARAARSMHIAAGCATAGAVHAPGVLASVRAFDAIPAAQRSWRAAVHGPVVEATLPPVFERSTVYEPELGRAGVGAPPPGGSGWLDVCEPPVDDSRSLWAMNRNAREPRKARRRHRWRVICCDTRPLRLDTRHSSADSTSLPFRLTMASGLAATGGGSARRTAAQTSTCGFRSAARRAVTRRLLKSPV